MVSNQWFLVHLSLICGIKCDTLKQVTHFGQKKLLPETISLDD